MKPVLLSSLARALLSAVERPLDNVSRKYMHVSITLLLYICNTGRTCERPVATIDRKSYVMSLREI